MKLEHLLFALILALGAVVLAIALWGADTHPTDHPQVPGMTHGGSGSERHGDSTLALGWLLGAVAIALFATLMAFGARRREGLQGLGRYLVAGALAHLAVWTALVLAYRGYLRDPDSPLFLAFPAPTAVMLYLLLPVPGIFVLYFVFGFRRWVLTPEEQATYERLLEMKEQREQREKEEAP